MEKNIATKSQIESELTQMQEFLETHLDDDINFAVQYGNDALVFYARSGKLLADAKMHRERKMRSELMAHRETIAGFPASIGNKFVDTLVEGENYLVNWADRINAALARRSDFCRTMISKAKEELRLIQQYQST